MINKAAHFTEQRKGEDKYTNNGTREPFQTLHSFLWLLLILNDWYFSARIPRLPVLEEKKGTAYWKSENSLDWVMLKMFIDN